MSDSPPTVVKDGLYNDRLLDTMQREQPQHRIMIILRAQGYSNKEIAKITDYSEVQVGTVLRQPWARERLLALLNDKGGNAIEQVLSGEVLESVNTLVAVRDDPMSGPQARLSAANAILDRALGKPTQRVETRNVSLSASLEDINRELEQLEAQERTLFGRNPTPAVEVPSVVQ